MNYNNEPFPNDINELIKKCDDVIDRIQKRFSDNGCLIVKDLYDNDKGHRQKDFVKKLQVECNTKLNDKIKKDNEVKGLYVFGELYETGNVIPVYVGISRTIFRRLYQHTWGTKHNEASFAYLKAKSRLEHSTKRETLALSEIQSEQEKIKNYRLIVIPELNDYDLYFMEVYIAGKLKTKWNSFKTH